MATPARSPERPGGPTTIRRRVPAWLRLWPIYPAVVFLAFFFIYPATLLLVLLVLLGRSGAVNDLLTALGLVEYPVRMIYNFVGVMIGMVHALMPLCVLTMLSVMINIDTNLTKAASTLGARGGQAFWRVDLPLSVPGVAAGGLLVFITALGFFITPALLGGRKDTMLVQLIIFHIHEVLNLGFAGAISLLLLVTVLAIFLL